MSLAPSQQEALQQLWAVTASSSDSARERDERILRDVNWDVQRAVETLFATDTGPPPAAGQSSTPATMEQLEVDDSLVTPPPRGSRRLSGTTGRRNPGTAGLGVWNLIVWPVNVVLSIITGGWYFFSGTIRRDVS
jgi:FAS-associated factor 2